MIELERQVPSALYRQIGDWMSQQIASGAWPEHFKLKSEVELARELGVNRGTLRKACEKLIAQGQLVRIHGRGTFVAGKTLEQPLADRLIAFSEDLARKGEPFETRVLEQGLVTPMRRITTLLGLPEDAPVFSLRRVRAVRGAPLIVLHNYVAPARCPGIEKRDFQKHGLFETLERAYVLDIDWGQRSFQAQSATAEIADLLGIAPAAPVMYMEQVVYLQGAEPIELSEVWLRGDRFRLSAVVKRESDDSASQTLQEYLSETANI